MPVRHYPITILGKHKTVGIPVFCIAGSILIIYGVNVNTTFVLLWCVPVFESLFALPN